MERQFFCSAHFSKAMFFFGIHAMSMNLFGFGNKVGLLEYNHPNSQHRMLVYHTQYIFIFIFRVKQKLPCGN